MTHLQLNTPWSLHFDRDGTEDIAIIRDAHGDDLVTSRHFWLPEGTDPVPPTLAAMQVMAAAVRTTTTYLVTAWCDRPFFARCEVDAESPHEALAKARQAVADAPVEECDEGYYWDEWRVDTPEEDGVLRHLDAPARLRDAAASLLAACRMVVDRWEQGDLAEAARACRDAVAAATGRTV